MIRAIKTTYHRTEKTKYNIYNRQQKNHNLNGNNNKSRNITITNPETLITIGYQLITIGWFETKEETCSSGHSVGLNEIAY